MLKRKKSKKRKEKKRKDPSKFVKDLFVGMA